MNQQQLQMARAALWRQNAKPLEIFDEAAAWLEEIGFCLFLPRHAQLPAPAPSFVEACSGQAAAMPGAAAVERAFSFAARLVGQGEALPLNLLGTVSEQPDFLATPEVLPWLAAVHGDRNWKSAPGGRTAPVVVRTWEVLEREPGRTVAELREILGREVTAATVLRALVELWTTLRAVPDYAPGEPTRWSLLRKQWSGELARGANTAQTTALSALISVYLRSALAATGEEIEIFLSPLTSRSRIREVVHGMMATRQLATMAIGPDTLLYIEGSLPELVPEAGEQGAAEQDVIVVRPGAEQRPETRGELRSAGPERPRLGQPQRRGKSAPAAEPWKKFRPREERKAPGRFGKPRFEKGEKKQGFAAREAPGGRKEGQRGKTPPWQQRRGAKPWQKTAQGTSDRRGDRARFGQKAGEAGDLRTPEMRRPERGDGPRREQFAREGRERRTGGFGGRGKPFRGNRPEDRGRGGFRGKQQREDRGSSDHREPRRERSDRGGFPRPGSNRPARTREDLEGKADRSGNAGEQRSGGSARPFGSPKRGGAPPRKGGFARGGRPTNRGPRNQRPDRSGRKKNGSREKEKPE